MSKTEIKTLDEAYAEVHSLHAKYIPNHDFVGKIHEIEKKNSIPILFKNISAEITRHVPIRLDRENLKLKPVLWNKIQGEFSQFYKVVKESDSFVKVKLRSSANLQDVKSMWGKLLVDVKKAKVELSTAIPNPDLKEYYAEYEAEQELKDVTPKRTLFGPTPSKSPKSQKTKRTIPSSKMEISEPTLQFSMEEEREYEYVKRLLEYRRKKAMEILLKVKEIDVNQKETEKLNPFLYKLNAEIKNPGSTRVPIIQQILEDTTESLPQTIKLEGVDPKTKEELSDFYIEKLKEVTNQKDHHFWKSEEFLLRIKKFANDTKTLIDMVNFQTSEFNSNMETLMNETLADAPNSLKFRIQEKITELLKIYDKHSSLDSFSDGHSFESTIDTTLTGLSQIGQMVDSWSRYKNEWKETYQNTPEQKSQEIKKEDLFAYSHLPEEYIYVDFLTNTIDSFFREDVVEGKPVMNKTCRDYIETYAKYRRENYPNMKIQDYYEMVLKEQTADWMKVVDMYEQATMRLGESERIQYHHFLAFIRLNKENIEKLMSSYIQDTEADINVNIKSRFGQNEKPLIGAGWLSWFYPHPQEEELEQDDFNYVRQHTTEEMSEQSIREIRGWNGFWMFGAVAMVCGLAFFAYMSTFKADNTEHNLNVLSNEAIQMNFARESIIEDLQENGIPILENTDEIFRGQFHNQLEQLANATISYPTVVDENTVRAIMETRMVPYSTEMIDSLNMAIQTREQATHGAERILDEMLKDFEEHDFGSVPEIKEIVGPEQFKSIFQSAREFMTNEENWLESGPNQNIMEETACELLKESISEFKDIHPVAQKFMDETVGGQYFQRQIDSCSLVKNLYSPKEYEQGNRLIFSEVGATVGDIQSQAITNTLDAVKELYNQVDRERLEYAQAREDDAFPRLVNQFGEVPQGRVQFLLQNQDYFEKSPTYQPQQLNLTIAEEQSPARLYTNVADTSPFMKAISWIYNYSGASKVTDLIWYYTPVKSMDLMWTSYKSTTKILGNGAWNYVKNLVSFMWENPVSSGAVLGALLARLAFLSMTNVSLIWISFGIGASLYGVNNFIRRKKSYALELNRELYSIPNIPENENKIQAAALKLENAKKSLDRWMAMEKVLKLGGGTVAFSINAIYIYEAAIAIWPWAWMFMTEFFGMNVIANAISRFFGGEPATAALWLTENTQWKLMRWEWHFNLAYGFLEKVGLGYILPVRQFLSWAKSAISTSFTAIVRAITPSYLRRIIPSFIPSPLDLAARLVSFAFLGVVRLVTETVRTTIETKGGILTKIGGGLTKLYNMMVGYERYKIPRYMRDRLAHLQEINSIIEKVKNSEIGSGENLEKKIEEAVIEHILQLSNKGESEAFYFYTPMFFDKRKELLKEVIKNIEQKLREPQIQEDVSSNLRLKKNRLEGTLKLVEIIIEDIDKHYSEGYVRWVTGIEIERKDMQNLIFKSMMGAFDLFGDLETQIFQSFIPYGLSLEATFANELIDARRDMENWRRNAFWEHFGSTMLITVGMGMCVGLSKYLGYDFYTVSTSEMGPIAQEDVIVVPYGQESIIHVYTNRDLDYTFVTSGTLSRLQTE